MKESAISWAVTAALGILVVGFGVFMLVGRQTGPGRASTSGAAQADVSASGAQPSAGGAQAGPAPTAPSGAQQGTDTASATAALPGTAASAADVKQPAVQPAGRTRPAPKIYPKEDESQPPSPYSTKEQFVEGVFVGQFALGPAQIQEYKDVVAGLEKLHEKYVTVIEKLEQERQKAFEEAHARQVTPEEATALELEWRKKIAPYRGPLCMEERKVLNLLRPRLDAQGVTKLDTMLGDLYKMWQEDKKLLADEQRSP